MNYIMGVKWLKLLLSIYTCAFVQSLDILKKSWNLPSNFPDLEKVLKIEIKCKKKMVKRLECFFFEQLQQVFYKWIFFFVLVKSHSISPVRLECITERALFLHYFFIVSINHLFYNLDSGEKKKLFWKKCGKNLESWILKSVGTLIQILCTCCVSTLSLVPIFFSFVFGYDKVL